MLVWVCIQREEDQRSHLPFNLNLTKPNQPLQLTAGSLVLIMFVGLRRVSVCRAFSANPRRARPHSGQLNLGRDERCLYASKILGAVKAL